MTMEKKMEKKLKKMKKPAKIQNMRPSIASTHPFRHASRFARYALWLVGGAIALGGATGALQAEEPTLDELLGIPGEAERADSAPEAARDDNADPGKDADAPGRAAEPPPRRGDASEASEASDVSPRRGGDGSEGELELDSLQSPDPQETLKAIVSGMDDSARRLVREMDPGIETRRVQREVLDRLDQLIAQAKKQRQKQNASSQQASKPREQGEGAAARSGSGSQASANGRAGTKPGGRSHSGEFSPGQVGPTGPDGEPLVEGRKQWGNLPPRVLEQLEQGFDEPYSAIYRELTERYYRELAEDDSP